MRDPALSGHSPPLRYVVITMVRDEEAFLPRTIASVTGQTLIPAAWICVDDGSLDRTPQLLADAAAAHPWIEVVTLAGRPQRNAGEAAARGFNEVLPRALAHEPDVVAMLDGDTEFDPRYYETLLAALAADPKLGIVGGHALEPHADGSWGRVRIPAYHVHGATKTYRRQCLEQLGGLAPGIAWDTVDIVRARLRGWTTRTLPEAAFRHLRVIGSAGGLARAPWIRGRAAYLAGYHPLFAAARAVRNMFRPPLLRGGFYFLQGYVSGCRERAPRMLDPEEIRAFRREQLRALTGRRSWWR
jgi:biofilm PGA synthesis N-glycosyltransferase PgaC